MKCPKCQYTLNSDNRCNNLYCTLCDHEINMVNPDDIKESFWNSTYLIWVTAQGILFLVNADCEQDAIDEMIDYIESMKWDGLLLDYNDSDDMEMIESGDYICGGNHGRYLSTYHIRIESL